MHQEQVDQSDGFSPGLVVIGKTPMPNLFTSNSTLCSTDSKPPIAISDTLLAVNISDAISSGNLSRLKQVLKEMNSTLSSFSSPFGNLLHIAASFGQVELLKQLIEESGLSVNSQTDQGSTPLHVAARQNRADIVEFLMDYEGIDDTIRDLEGRTPLECCKSRQMRNIIEYKRSVHIATVTKLMHQFVHKQDLDGFKGLFSGKSKRNLHLIDVNCPNSRGDTILHEAAKTGNFDLVQACLNLGADPFQKNRKGKIPVELTRKEAVKNVLKSAPMIKSKMMLSSKTERVEGFLHKWTNYAGGYRRRWFILEHGILSYFASQAEFPATCRGSINLEFFKIVPHRTDLCKFELHGLRNASIKYFLKADNQEEAKRWIFSLAQAQTTGNLSLLQESRSLPNLLQLINDSNEECSAPETPKSVTVAEPVSVDHLFGELLKQEVELSAFFDLLIDLNRDEPSKLSLGMITDAHSLFLKSIRSIREQLLKLEASLSQKERRLSALKNEKQILEDAVRALAVENNRMQERFKSLPEDEAFSEAAESFRSVDQTQSVSSNVDSTIDSEDEFFDAYEDSFAIQELSLKSHVPISKGPANFDPVQYGYPSRCRPTLPADSTTMPAISLWNILKNAIQQQDLTKMPIPINFSEPISMLQRMCEDLEYVQLLERAAQETDPARKLLYISAFAISSYSSTDGRVSKPFNPLLGETFEFVHPQGKFRYLAEQVSHHPPIGASYCEGPGFVYWNEVHVSSRFRGKYLELRPEGLTHLKLNDSHYSWNRVNTAVNNIIVGKLYLEHYGTMQIQQHGSDLCAEIEFLPSGWRRASCNRIRGVVKNNATGEVLYAINGKWNEELFASANEEEFSIWKRKPQPPEAVTSYNMTEFAMSLNELSPQLAALLCPSDSRLRPDQRAMEEGRFTEASELKVKLEEKQRKARKLMESGPDFVYEPRWFRRSLEADSEAPHWAYLGGYWEARKARSFSKIPEIYL